MDAAPVYTPCAASCHQQGPIGAVDAPAGNQAPDAVQAVRNAYRGGVVAGSAAAGRATPGAAAARRFTRLRDLLMGAGTWAAP